MWFFPVTCWGNQPLFSRNPFFQSLFLCNHFLTDNNDKPSYHIRFH